MTHFRVCAFEHDKDKPISYKRISDLPNLKQEIGRIVEKTNADYVSLRIVREKEAAKQTNL